MTVRVVKRRGERRLVIDIVYKKPDGSPGRFRRDAEVQLMAAARAEERRRLALLAATGSPEGDDRSLEEGEGRADASAPPPPGPEGLTFAEVVELFRATYAKSHLKPSTRHGYDQVLSGVLLPRFGSTLAAKIGASEVRALDASMVERGLKPSTRRNTQVVLRAILGRFAVEAKLLPRAPELPGLPKVGSKIPRVLSTDELNQLLRAAGPEARLVFLLSALAGLRGGEIRALTWQDVDLRHGTITVRNNLCRGQLSTPKSGHERSIPLVLVLRERLASLSQGATKTDLVARNSRGTPWTEAALVRAFRRASEAAGVEGFRFHDLRHYFVTSLFRSGTPAPTVQALAGHGSLSVTQRYAHVGQGELAEAVARLGASSVVTAW